MRRLKVLFFWLFVNRNNVSAKELLAFLVKPKVHQIAKKFIKNIVKGDDYQVTFNNLDKPLYWPLSFSIDRLNQITAETFDTADWHFYQKEHTQITTGDILLDIGTAEGLFPLTVAGQCKHLYLVEPSSFFNTTLHKTFQDYEGKTTIFHTAVGNQDGTIPFDENSLDGAISTADNTAATQIPIHKIDTLLAGKPITYLKADIEGFEEEMLRGAELTIKNSKPKIAITSYHTQNDPKEIIAIIRGFVPEYKYYVKGIYEKTPKPVLIHFWI